MVKIAIMGFGTVGSGVGEIIAKNAGSISKKAGQDIEIKYILNRSPRPNSPFKDYIVNDFEKIIQDDEVKVVVESIGGMHPAYEYTKRLLLAKKHVVTSNKELVSTKGDELLQIALDNNVNYLFEASVGGGIPIIRPLNQCLAGNEVVSITGILNGTTNYILSQMIHEQKSFDEALQEAQEKGYAEADPTADVEGADACRKIAILSSLAFGKHIDPNKIYTEGITKISLSDVEYAQADGKVIKLLGRSEIFDDGRVFAMVSPCMVSSINQLANVEDVYNGILVSGDSLGEVMFYGRGAGKLPTASAVVADVIDAVKHLERRLWFYWGPEQENSMVDYKKVQTRFYLRFACTDPVQTMELTARYFGYCHDIRRNIPNEVAFITPLKEEGILLDQLQKFMENDCVKGLSSKIRVIE